MGGELVPVPHGDGPLLVPGEVAALQVAQILRCGYVATTVHTKFELILGQSWGHTCQGSADIGQGGEVLQCWVGD